MKNRIVSFRAPKEIIFGIGALKQLPQAVKDINAKNVCIVTDAGVKKAGWADALETLLKKEGINTYVFDEVLAEPSTRSIDKCAKFAMINEVKLFIGFGGGSSMDVAKGASIVATHGGSIFDYLGVDNVPGETMSKILIPTTAGTGSEVTPFAIFKDRKKNVKTAVQSRYIISDIVLVDPEIIASCPPKVTAVCGMDALTHAIESYTSVYASVFTEHYSLKAINLIGNNLLKTYANGDNMEARRKMALGSLYAGYGIANAGSGIVGALSYPVEGKYNIIHGISNSLLLPYAIKFNSIADYEKIENVARELGLRFNSGKEATEKLIQFINELLKEFNFPRILRDVGAKENDIKELADDGITRQRVLKNNIRKIEYEDVIKFYKMAF